MIRNFYLTYIMYIRFFIFEVSNKKYHINADNNANKLLFLLIDINTDVCTTTIH